MPISATSAQLALRRLALDPKRLPMLTWGALLATFVLGWIAMRYVALGAQWYGYSARPENAEMYRGLHAGEWCYLAPFLAWLVPWLMHRRKRNKLQCFEVVRAAAENAHYRFVPSLKSRLVPRAAHRACQAFMQRLSLFGLLLVLGLPWVQPPRIYPARCLGWGWAASFTDIHLLSALWLLVFIAHIPTSRRILGAPPL